MTPQEADREEGGQSHNTYNDPAGCVLHCFFTHTHSFQGRPEVPDVHLNLGSVTAVAQKWDEMWALLTSAADTMCFSMKGPYVFGSEGQARGFAERPVQSITKSSLPFCSESFHVAGRVKALSRTPNRAAYPRYYRSLCNFSRVRNPVRELCS